LWYTAHQPIQNKIDARRKRRCIYMTTRQPLTYHDSFHQWQVLRENNFIIYTDIFLRYNFPSQTYFQLTTVVCTSFTSKTGLRSCLHFALWYGIYISSNNKTEDMIKYIVNSRNISFALCIPKIELCVIFRDTWTPRHLKNGRWISFHSEMLLENLRHSNKVQAD
jgi:hypothetical protein